MAKLGPSVNMVFPGIVMVGMVRSEKECEKEHVQQYRPVDPLWECADTRRACRPEATLYKTRKGQWTAYGHGVQVAGRK
eukprot:970231-Pelagomonas_calceolata.AAC.3